ncbi:lipopolysaccharide biosynthesis protein [Pseudomonas sp. BP8]|uniref:lipopolysaccharide biosynthesis protein n=1 Tax=Pseudomonas sp. BP8 TaxID=2817864 RepID=UPI001DE798B3|nr:lipopolysaccharide biosynthesis protein [Pseudomonas sp. BP8]MBP2263649.1 KDO transferase-3 [Pseudomonas sp. BP8]
MLCGYGQHSPNEPGLFWLGSKVSDGMNSPDLPVISERLVIHDLASVRNSAEGAVFIVASGQSVQGFPIERFADVPMITMNGAINKFVGTPVVPYFYVCTDSSFPLQQPRLFGQALLLSQRIALWPEQLATLPVVPAGELFALSKAVDGGRVRSLLKPGGSLVRSRALWQKRSRSLGFSKDLSHGFFDARTVAYVALQLAYHLGFSQVFLVGVDLQETAGRFYEREGGVRSPCGLDEHYRRRILPSLKLMARRVVGAGFEVYNLSECSRVPASVIPRAGIGDVRGIIAEHGGRR